MADKNRVLRLLKSFLIWILLEHILVSANPSKRDISKESETVITHLENVAASLPIIRFNTDPVLIQKSDKANAVTKYYLVGEGNTVIYERNVDDSAKEVIVLKGDEDKLSFKKFKRIYVVLRKRPSDESEKHYFVNLVFLRVANEKDINNVIVVDGVKQAVEWIPFDEHVVPGQSQVKVKIFHCVSSFIVPCSFNESALVPTEEFVTSPRFKANVPPQALVDEEQGKPFQLEGGSDPMDSYDLFGDLDSSKIQGRLFDSDVGILGGLLSGVGGILCTVVSIIASCADERAHGHLMSPDLAASAALSQNPIGMLFGRKKRDVTKSTDADKLLDYPGWKTQFHDHKKSVSSKFAKILFYGLGNCPYVESDPTTLKAATTTDEVVTFYLKALRTQCITWMKEYLTKLVDIGLIEVQEKALTINQTHQFVTEPKLTLNELIQLTAAVELDAFTDVYVDEYKRSIQPMDSKSPDDLRVISESVHFVVNVGIKAIERIGLHNRNHMVHLFRHMLLSFESIFTKLREDAQNLENCLDDCKHDKEINFNDRVQVLALINFIKTGLGSVVSGSDARNHFKTFYIKNVKSIEKLVNIYA